MYSRWRDTIDCEMHYTAPQRSLSLAMFLPITESSREIFAAGSSIVVNMGVSIVPRLTSREWVAPSPLTAYGTAIRHCKARELSCCRKVRIHETLMACSIKHAWYVDEECLTCVILHTPRNLLHQHRLIAQAWLAQRRWAVANECVSGATSE